VSALKLDIHKQRQEIEARAEVAGAWQRFEKWWGFREKTEQPYGDETFWCLAELILWCRDEWLGREAINSLRYPAKGDGGQVKIHDGVLSVIAPLGARVEQNTADTSARLEKVHAHIANVDNQLRAQHQHDLFISKAQSVNVSVSGEDSAEKPLAILLTLKDPAVTLTRVEMFNEIGSVFGSADCSPAGELNSHAASTYVAIVSKVSSHCGASLAVKLVTEAYIERLRPHLHGGDGNGQAGRSNSSAGSQPNRKPTCEKCIKAYQLLDPAFGASEDEVKSKRRALAEVLHPDHLGGKSEGARHAAEQQLKSINAACDHVLQCSVAGSTA